MEVDNTERLLSKLAAQAETLAQLSHQLGESTSPEAIVSTAARLLARLTSFDSLHLLVLDPDGATRCWSHERPRARRATEAPPRFLHFEPDRAPDDVVHWLLALRQSLLVRSRIEIEALPCAEPFHLLPDSTESALSTTFDLGHRRRGALAIASNDRDTYDPIDRSMLRYFGTTLAAYLNAVLNAGAPVTGSRHHRRPDWDAIPHPLLTFDRHGRLAAHNAAAHSLFDAADLERARLNALPLPGNGTLKTLLEVALAERRPFQQLALDSGRDRWLVSLTPLPPPADASLLELLPLPPEPAAAALETRSARAALSLGRGVAQYYGNIFTGLKMWSQLVTDATERLLDGEPVDDEIRQTLHDGLAAITDGVTRGEHVVDRLADIAGDKRRTTRSNVFALAAVAEGAVELLRRTHPRVASDVVHLLLHADPSEPGLLSGDPYGLRTAVHQLLANAVEAAGDGGTVRVLISSNPSDDLLRLDITDDGPGLSEQARAQATDPFFTTRGNAHVGLGLTVVEAILRRFGGTLTLTDARPGTTATLTLPRLTAPRPTAPRTTGTQGASTRVALIVSEDAITLQRQSRMLRGWGLQSLTAASGQEAVALTDRLSRLDLVLIEQQLPDMTGTSLASVVSSAFPTAHIAILTDDPEPQLSPRMSRAGIRQLLQRPLRALALRALIDDLER